MASLATLLIRKSSFQLLTLCERKRECRSGHVQAAASLRAMSYGIPIQIGRRES